jgi:hypothetical protein
LDVRLLVAQLLPEATRNLLGDEIDAGDHLGDRMLDLDAGVHLDEVELAVLEEELEGAGAAVADALAGLDADRADLLALRFSLMPGAGASSMTFWWRRCIEQSRSPRWIALPCCRRAPGSRCGAGSRGTSPGTPGRCRRRPGLGAGQETAFSSALGVHHAHAATTAAAGGLDDHRVADALGDRGIPTGSSPSGLPEPGTQGTPASFIAVIAETLSPIRRMVSARGR